MVCSIYKWFISQAMDREKPFSQRIWRHIDHCPDCAGYVHFSTSLKDKSITDARPFLQRENNILKKKIIGRLAKSTDPLPDFKQRPKLILALTGAMVVIFIGINIFFFWQRESISPMLLKNNSISSTSQLSTFEKSIPKIINRLENPIEIEMTRLKKSVQSASDFLSSCWDVKIGKRK